VNGPFLLFVILHLFGLPGWTQTPDRGQAYWVDQFPGRDMGEKINNALASSEPVIRIPAGEFTYSTPIRINRSVRLEGSGKTTLISTSGTSDQIELGPGADYSSIDNLKIYTKTTEAPTSGVGIKVNARFVEISGVTIWNQFDGIVALGPQNLSIENCDIRSVNDNIHVMGGSGLTVTNTKLYAGGNTTGLHLTEAAGIWLTDVEIFGGATGILFDPSPSQGVRQIFAKGVVVDTVNKDGISVAGSGPVYHVDFVDSWVAGSKTGNGINFTNPRTNGFVWTGGFIRGNHLNGVLIQAGTNIEIAGAQISANGQQNGTQDNTYGVKVAAGVGHFKIANCFLGPTGYDNQTQSYGVFIASGASDFFQVTNNMDTGNTKGHIIDNSTGKHKVVSGNL
jgi:hypothetical protein